MISLTESLLKRNLTNTKTYTYNELEEAGYYNNYKYEFYGNDLTVDIGDDLIVIHLNDSLGVFLDLDKIAADYSIKKLIIDDANTTSSIRLGLIGKKKISIEITNNTSNLVDVHNKKFRGNIIWKSLDTPVIDYYLSYLGSVWDGRIKLESNSKPFDKSHICLSIANKRTDTGLMNDEINYLLKAFIDKNGKLLPDNLPFSLYITQMGFMRFENGKWNIMNNDLNNSKNTLKNISGLNIRDLKKL